MAFSMVFFVVFSKRLKIGHTYRKTKIQTMIMANTTACRKNFTVPDPAII